MVKRVGQRISAAAKRWLDANNYQGYLKDYKWEYNLVQEETVNAWCMPGGKIVFYTGIMPIAGMKRVYSHYGPRGGTCISKPWTATDERRMLQQ